MTEETRINEKFNNVCFTLSEEDILRLEEADNEGSINNVLANIYKECFGVRLWDETSVEMYYITKEQELLGDIICLKLDDSDYSYLLLKFCNLLSVNYRDLDAIDSFNKFQNKLRSFLEKLGFSTVTTSELKKIAEQFTEQEASITSFAPKGIRKIELINKVDFFRDIFSENYNISDSGINNFVYLMVNTDTSLIKIGFSSYPRYRERTLHSKEPTIYLIACWEGDKKREKELHQKYKDKRIRGEWFRLNLIDLYELEEFMR